MKFLTLDNAYHDAFEALPHANHEEWFEKGCFGTSDFLDVALRAVGHEAKTLVRNFFSFHEEMMEVGQAFQPDVVVSREAGRFSGPFLRARFPKAKLVCTCSHRVDFESLREFDVTFSSFPWMPDHMKSLGMRCEYLPLAFGKPVLDRVKYDGPRDIDVCFLGGLGTRIWDRGTRVIAEIAAAMPEQMIWHGYVAGSLSDLPVALQKAYRGPVWGAKYFKTLMRTKIALNRHGEIARGFANNTRCYEAGGCGCLLLDDCHGELQHSLAYEDGRDAVEFFVGCLMKLEGHGGGWESEAKLLHEEVMADHTYEARVPRFLEVIGSL